jgi:hypothetical protein
MTSLKIKIQFLMLIPILALVIVACKKDPPPNPEPTEPVLPPLTNTGANTFGCYINGELFVANNGESFWSLPAISGSFDEIENLLSIQGSREIDRDENSVKSDNLRYRVAVSDGPGVYDMYFETDHYKGYASTGLDKCDYYHNLLDRGVCEITFLDKEQNIIAGTFHMDLINEDCAEDTLMKITDGRFDFQY